MDIWCPQKFHNRMTQLVSITCTLLSADGPTIPCTTFFRSEIAIVPYYTAHCRVKSSVWVKEGVIIAFENCLKKCFMTWLGLGTKINWLGKDRCWGLKYALRVNFKETWFVEKIITLFMLVYLRLVSTQKAQSKIHDAEKNRLEV